MKIEPIDEGFLEAWKEACEDWTTHELMSLIPCEDMVIVATSGGTNDRVRVCIPISRCLCIGCRGMSSDSSFHEYEIELAYLAKDKKFAIISSGWIERSGCSG